MITSNNASSFSPINSFHDGLLQITSINVENDMNLLIIGLFSSNLTAIAGALIMHLSHGFVAAGLFIFIGHLADRFYTRNIKYLRGLSGPLPLLEKRNRIQILAYLVP